MKSFLSNVRQIKPKPMQDGLNSVDVANHTPIRNAVSARITARPEDEVNGTSIDKNPDCPAIVQAIRVVRDPYVAVSVFFTQKT